MNKSSLLLLDATGKTTTVLILILVVLGIFATLYFLFTLRRLSSAYKKMEYFFEDLTYKAESLNATVDAIARTTNYIEIFEAFSKRNIKSWVKVTVKNKDVFYKLFDRVKSFANDESK